MKITKTGHKRIRNRRSTLKELRRAKKPDASHAGFGDGSQPMLPPQIDLPRDFRLSENFSEAAGSILNVRNRLRQKRRSGRPPSINFNCIVEVDNAAALMLAAEIHAWNRDHPHIKLRSHDDVWKPEVAEIFDEMGLFDLLGVPRRGARMVACERDTAYVPFMHGSRTDKFEDVPSFLEKIEKHMGMPLQQRSYLLTGMGEAVINAWEHGYEREAGAEWWVSASCNKMSGELTVFCYDRGLTIPGTLPRSSIWESIRDKIPGKEGADCELIEAALTTRRTQTRNKRRGKGLRHLMLFIDKFGRGELKIHSRWGMVCYAKSDIEQDGKFIKKQLDKEIKGTLIEWRVSAPLE